MPRSLVPPDMCEALDRAVGNLLPEYMREGFLAYLHLGRPVGHFLTAVLSNDLLEACNRGDEANKRALADYVFVLVNYAPSTAWGSAEKVAAWAEAGRQLLEDAR
jgi:hypothetical protein